ncbi:hypothetical protein BDR07DRAFT_1386277 [Suillus spraguei]|nr:hypothetical protein BDR07DRAFT_1386277 [Suillus spraguei]
MATAPADRDLNAEGHPMMCAHDADMRPGMYGPRQRGPMPSQYGSGFARYPQPKYIMILVCLMAPSPHGLSLHIVAVIMMLLIVTLEMVMLRAIGTLQAVHILVQEGRYDSMSMVWA